MTNSILTKFLKIFIIFLTCLVGYVTFKLTLSYIVPLLLAISIAIFIEPAVQLLIRKVKIPRAAASIFVVILLLCVMIGFLILTITEIYQGISFLAEFIPEQLRSVGIIFDHYFHQFILPIYENILTMFNRLADTEQLMIQDYIDELFGLFAQWIGDIFQNVLFSIPSAFTFIPESITILLFLLLATIIISADLPNLINRVQTLIPDNIAEKGKDLVRYLKMAGTGFIKAQLILVSISFFIILIGLLALQINHAFTIALLMLIIDLIPYVGTGLLFLPWIFYCFLTGNYTLTIGLSIIYAIIVLSRQFIEPKVLSMNMGIHPLAWLVAAFFGYKLWGVAGLLIAPFVLVFIKGLLHIGLLQSIYQFINK